MKGLLIIGFAFLLVSCHSNGNGFQVQKTLPTDIKDKAVSIDAVPVQIDTEFLFAWKYLVYEDSILIVLNSEKTKDWFVEIYNLNTNRVLSKLFHKGNGPGEMLSCLINLNDNCLSAHDYVKNTVSFVDMRDIYGSHPCIPICKHVYFHCVSSFDKQKFIALNPYCFDKSGYFNNQPRVIFGEKGKPIDFETPPNVTNTYNVSQGFFVTNSSKGRIVFFSNTEPLIEMFDSSLNTLTQIQGPDVFEIKYSMCDNRSLAFSKRFPVTYRDGATSDANKIIAPYIGEWYGTNKSGPKSYLFVFDWDGNVLASYSCPAAISFLSLSKDGRSIYATSDEKGIAKLVKLRLH